MRRLYFFDKQFNYKDVIVINNFNPIVDIISTQSFKIETPLMPIVASGDICILKDNNEVVFIGNILNVEESEKKTKTITISYIDELFNINGEVEDLSGNIITWITNTLTTNFISVSDNLQKISLSVVNNCATAYSGTYTFESTNIKDCLRNIFNYSGVYVDFEIDFADNGSIDSLVCNIRSNIEENTIKLKYNMPIISEIKRTVTNLQNINKLVILPDSSVTGGSRYEFYLLKDGTISTDASNVNRFENVKQDIKYYASDFTAESLLNTAKEVLGGEQFNHSIGFYIKHNSTFNISLYKKILFYDKDNIVYNSIITKIQYGTEFDYVELGVVRLKLTDKLQKKDTKTATSSSSSGGGSYVLPQATASTLGGIIAETKTTETNEVKIDTATGKLYASGVGSVNMDNVIDGETYVKTENNLTDTLKSNYDTAYTNTHTHSNKTLLDTYTQTEVDLADAVSKKHTHSNKTILDNTTASYTTDEQTKLSGIANGAEVNVQSDWNATSGDAFILNKPTTISGYGITDAYTKTEVNTALSGKVDKTSIKNEFDSSTTAVYSSKYVEDNFAQMLFTTTYYANKTATTTANLTSVVPTLNSANYLSSTTTNTAFNWTTPNYTFTNTLTGGLSLQASSLIYLSVPFSISVASETVNFGYRVKVNGTAISSNQTFGAVAYTGGSGHTDINRVYLQCTTDLLTSKTNYVAGDIVTIEVFTQQATSTSMVMRVYCGCTIDSVDYYTYNELAQFRSQLSDATPNEAGIVYGHTSNLSSNTFYGYRTGYNNTTGRYNTFNGKFAGRYNTTGDKNTFNGQAAGFSNLTGSSNVFTGADTGVFNTTGNYNTFNGQEAGFSNSTGSYNVYGGYRAGQSNHTSNNSTFIGAETKALADNQTNEIVIGYEATGHGSNTATIGNSSITNNYFTGNVRATGDILIPTGKTLKINNVDVIADKAKVDASNLTSGNVDSWQNKLGYERVETVYDKDNASATYNWGYTSGIQGGVTVTGKDLTKYKRLKIYYVTYGNTFANNGGVSNVCELDLSHTIGGYAVADYMNAYFSDLGVESNFFKFKVEYKMSSTFDLYFRFAFGTTYQNSNSYYYVYKIEGIF